MRIYDSLDDAFRFQLAPILEEHNAVAPRGKLTWERTDASFRLVNPLARLIHNPGRNWSIHYAIGELLWHLSASDDLDFIAHYSRKWRQFSSDGRTVSGSCYGAKLFKILPDGKSRFDLLVDVLKADTDTRRAVAPLHDLSQLAIATHSPDIPCCVLLHFLIRDEQLCLINYMRSNDVMFGFGYDVFLFTTIQELMATRLGLPLGWYQHLVGSLHAYSEDLDRAKAVVVADNIDGPQMPPMAEMDSLPRVFEYERIVRTTRDLDAGLQFEVQPYWRAMLDVLLFYRLRRLRRRADMRVVAMRLSGTCFEPFIRRDADI